MRKFIYCLILLSTCLFLSCGSEDKGAQDHLLMAREALIKNDFSTAKSHLDSIQTLYPKAFDQRKAAIALLDTVRRTENNYNIMICDSLITYYQPKIDSMKSAFTYVINKEYQTKGAFVPKEGWNSGQLVSSTLRSGVSEDGQFYLESIYIGSNQIHNKIKVSAKDVESVESLPIEGDGLNYRFANSGKQYEIIKILPNNDNGISNFIVENQDKAITVTLEGMSKYSYTLPAMMKNAIRQSLNLSKAMSLVDSLNNERTKSAFKNYKLDEKKEIRVADENRNGE